MGTSTADDGDYESALEAATAAQGDQGYTDPTELYGGTGALSAAQMAEVGKQSKGLRDEGDKEYTGAITQQQKIAQGARDVLRAARDRLTNEKPDRSAMWLSVAEALGAPSPGFSDSLAQGFGAAAPYKENERRERLNRLTGVDALNTQLAEYGSDKDAFSPDMIQTRIAQARLKQLQANAIEVAALRHTGTNPLTGQTEISKLIAARDALPPGDPNRAAYDARIKILTTRAPNQQPLGDDVGNLLASLGDKGVSPPQGMRSIQAIRAWAQGLLRKHPDLNYDQIAQIQLSGQAGARGAFRAAATAGNIAGNVSVADQEIQQWVPLVRQSASKVDRSHWLPVQKLIQTADTQLQDPNLRALKININSLLNAYDMLAARGGTDISKRGEVRSLLTSADSPRVLETGLKQFMLEAQKAGVAAHKAVKASAHIADDDESGADNTSPPDVPRTNGKGWALHHDKNWNWAYVSPDGKQAEEVK